MARNGLKHISIYLILFAVSCQHVSALKCWNCRPTQEYCSDPFDENNISDAEKPWAYVECSPPPPNQFDHRSVCKKIVQTVNDNTMVTRSCFWENIYAPSDCMTQSQNIITAITTDFCETCTDDGCNAAIQHDAATLLVIVSAFVSKIYAF